MTEIINLRRVKKARDAAQRDAAAEQNRIRFGRTAGERAREELEQQRAARQLANALLDPAGSTPPAKPAK